MYGQQKFSTALKVSFNFIIDICSNLENSEEQEGLLQYQTPIETQRFCIRLF